VTAKSDRKARTWKNGPSIVSDAALNVKFFAIAVSPDARCAQRRDQHHALGGSFAQTLGTVLISLRPST
jgi:hypothetical protein